MPKEPPGDDDDLFAHARRTDPETSHEAAARVELIRETQQQIVWALSRHPMHDEQIYRTLATYYWEKDRPQLPRTFTPSGVRTRRAELVAKGVVRFSGSYGVTAAGRRTRIWELAAE